MKRVFSLPPCRERSVKAEKRGQPIYLINQPRVSLGCLRFDWVERAPRIMTSLSAWIKLGWNLSYLANAFTKRGFHSEAVTSLGRHDRQRLTQGTIERGVSRLTAENSPLGQERSTVLRVNKDSCVNMLGSRESRVRLKAKIEKRRQVNCKIYTACHTFVRSLPMIRYRKKFGNGADLLSI